VNISGGTVGDEFEARNGSRVTISGGTVGDNFTAFVGRVAISGGAIGSNFTASSGSVVNIAGGSVGDDFDANGGSTVNISGGSVGQRFSALAGSMVNISGTAFFVDGVAIDGLALGQPLTVNQRGVTLTGLLADMSPFSFDLNDTPVAGEDLVNSGAVLTVKLAVQGDYNGNGVVDAADFVLWRNSIDSMTDLQADGDGSGMIDHADYDLWRARFGRAIGANNPTASVIPEPVSIAMFLVGLLAAVEWRRLRVLCR
jgi:hypothetical protein